MHAQYPVQSCNALQVHASAAEAVLKCKRRKAGDWFVRATPTHVFAALCASADQRPRSHRAFEVLLPLHCTLPVCVEHTRCLCSLRSCLSLKACMVPVQSEILLLTPALLPGRYSTLSTTQARRSRPACTLLCKRRCLHTLVLLGVCYSLTLVAKRCTCAADLAAMLSWARWCTAWQAKRPSPLSCLTQVRWSVLSRTCTGS